MRISLRTLTIISFFFQVKLDDKTELKFTLLEGEEEENFIKKAIEDMKSFRNKNNDKRGGGGRFGKGNFNSRKRRGGNDAGHGGKQTKVGRD